MKKLLKRITFALFATTALAIIMFVSVLLNPSFLYANKTQFGTITVYHQQALDPAFTQVMEESVAIIRQAELYDPSYRTKLCLNDGSSYIKLAEKVRGPAFDISYDNVAVIMGKGFPKEKYAIFNNHKRKYAEIIAHELIHCYQVNAFGLKQLQIPFWKLEGYTEYAAMGYRPEFQDLCKNIDRLIKHQQAGLSGWDWIGFKDGYGTTINYYTYWVLHQYLIQEKGWSYAQIVADESTEAEIEQQMMDWYKGEPAP